MSKEFQVPVHENPVQLPTVLILTPVRDAARFAHGYFERLGNLTYPAELLSVGILEDGSVDGSYDMFRTYCKHTSRFRKINVWKETPEYRIPDGVARWEPAIQFKRRSNLARSRNHLLFHALDDEEWVLWLDVDVIEYPNDIIERLLSYNLDVLQPHCVKQYGGKTFDLNAWRDHGKLTIDAMREEGELAKLDAVGGTMLLVRADCHRDGLIFPTFFYGASNPKARSSREDIMMPDTKGELETEGLGIMASDMGIQCWCLPNLEVIHADD